jgi:hypothetical protein
MSLVAPCLQPPLPLTPALSPWEREKDEAEARGLESRYFFSMFQNGMFGVSRMPLMFER